MDDPATTLPAQAVELWSSPLGANVAVVALAVARRNVFVGTEAGDPVAVGLFAWAAHHLLSAARTPTRLLLALAGTAAALSAVLVKDTVCLFMTPLVLGIVTRAGLPPGPYLVALATSANLESALTLVGNPQNMLVGSMSGLSFSMFTGAVLPAVLAGLVVHAAVLWAAYALVLGHARLPALGPPPRLAPDAGLVTAVFGATVAAFAPGVHPGFAALAGAVALLLPTGASRRRRSRRWTGPCCCFSPGCLWWCAGCRSPACPIGRGSRSPRRCRGRAPGCSASPRR